MRNRLNILFLLALLILGITSASVAQTRAYRVTDRQMLALMNRIETRTDAYKREMDLALNRGRLGRSDTREMAQGYIADFETSTDQLKQRFDSGRSVANDVSDVLNRAVFIDRFMGRNTLTVSAQTTWTSLKTDLNTLANYYQVSWNWNQTLPEYPTDNNTGNNYPGNNYPGTGTGTGRWGTGGRGFDSRLTGTYRLNTGQSDDVNAVLDRSMGNYQTGQRDNMRRNLERRLSSPERMAIEKNGTSVTMASSLSPQVTFDADGVARTETTNRGRTIKTTASSNNNSLILNYEGDRMNDFNVVFEPARNGQLRVTRKIYLENRNEQVTVSSVYDKINNTAEWSTVNDNPTYGNNYPGTGPVGNTTGTFYIPNGTQLRATLTNAINTRDSQVNDRFTMEVVSPAQYQGAIIEGRVANADKSGRVSGRANVSLEFDTIRLRNGDTYRFAGLIDSVRAANGDTVTVNNEGTVRDNNQTTKTATRAGIGAALGAIIGAIAGGGSGAAVGAAVGAGAGAGTVLVQGRDNIDLGQGSEFTITSSSPANVGYNR
jgi:hypothetical protein